MHLWNIDKIVDKIRNKTFSETDKLKYYILTSTFVLFIIFEDYNFSDNSGILKLLLTIAIVFIGSIYLFNKNNEYDGKNFIERTTIFTVPISLRMIVVGFLYGLFSVIILYSLGYDNLVESPYYSVFIILIMSIISIYWQGLCFDKLIDKETN